MLQGRELDTIIKVKPSITIFVCVGRKLKANAVQKKCMSWKCLASLGRGRAAGVKSQPEPEQRQLARQI